MIISYSNKFVVIHLEKTGGTTVEKSIEPYLKLGDLYIRDWQIYMFSLTDGMTEHTGAPIVQKFLGEAWDDFAKFATVRNPVNIIRSMYNYGKYIHDNTPKSESLPEGAATAYLYSHLNHKGVDGFIDYMFGQEFSMVQSQYERLHPIINAGLIVDVTQLDDRWNEAMSYLGLNRVPMQKKNVLNSESIEISNKSISRIRNRFAADYDTFPNLTGAVWN